MKVLVVEDEMLLRLDITLQLQEKNFSVFEAGDGVTALTLTRQHQPNVILCDLSMPVLNGFEFLKQLRQDPLTADIPLIVLSSESSFDSRLRATRLGANAFLGKGADIDEILTTINTVVPTVSF